MSLQKLGASIVTAVLSAILTILGVQAVNVFSDGSNNKVGNNSTVVINSRNVTINGRENSGRLGSLLTVDRSRTAELLSRQPIRAPESPLESHSRAIANWETLGKTAQSVAARPASVENMSIKKMRIDRLQIGKL